MRYRPFLIAALPIAGLLVAAGCSPPVRGAVQAVPADPQPRPTEGPVRTQPQQPLPPREPIDSRSLTATDDDTREVVMGAQAMREEQVEASEQARAEARRLQRARAREDAALERKRADRLGRDRERRAAAHAEQLAGLHKAWEAEAVDRIAELEAEARARALEGAPSPQRAARDLAAALRARAALWRERARQARRDADEAWRDAQVYQRQGVTAPLADKRAVEADQRAYELDLLAAQAAAEANWGDRAVEALAP